MPGLAPGAVVGGRYTAQRLLGEHAGAQSWVARDETGRATVVLVVVPEEHPQALAVLDAANRARGVDNPRLVRILEVGRDGGVVYFAEEALDGGASLTQLAARGGLEATEVRRLTGEAALALDAGQVRGLHHLSLTPDSLVRMPDGSVRIAGLATQAALAGQDHIGGVRALRRDAQGLVSLAYAALTGRWPHGPTTALEPAPRVFGGVPRPSEIAVGVPADLDTICHQTLSEGLGPSSPADYAAQVAPWPGMPIGGTQTAVPDPVAAGVSGAAAAAGALGAAGIRGVTTPGAAEPTQALPVSAPAAAGHEAPASGVAASRAAASAGHVTGVAAAGGPASAVPAEIPANVPDSGGPGSVLAPPAVASTAPRGARASGPASPGAAAPGAGVPGAGVPGAAAAGAAIGAVGSRLAGLGKAATGRVGGVLGEGRAIRRAQRADEAARVVSIDQAPAATDLEPPAPLLPAEAGAPPSPMQRRVVLALFAALVFIAGALGAMGASRIGTHTDLGGVLGDTSGHRTTSTSSTSSSTTDSGSGTPLAISAATGFDPQGDGNENNALAARVYDEDAATYWQTEGYQGPTFAGLKTGVGVLLDFGQVATPKKVVLTLPTPSSFELYLGNEQSLDGATKIGSSAEAQGTVTIESDGSASGQFLIVWFTSSPRLADGSYRATLAEVSVDG